MLHAHSCRVLRSLLHQYALVDVDQRILLLEMMHVATFELKLALHVFVLSFFGLIVS